MVAWALAFIGSWCLHCNYWTVCLTWLSNEPFIDHWLSVASITSRREMAALSPLGPSRRLSQVAGRKESVCYKGNKLELKEIQRKSIKIHFAWTHIFYWRTCFKSHAQIQAWAVLWLERPSHIWAALGDVNAMITSPDSWSGAWTRPCLVTSLGHRPLRILWLQAVQSYTQRVGIKRIMRKQSCP